MRIKKLFVLFLIFIMVYSCSELLKPEVSGEKHEIEPPQTRVLNIPSPNAAEPLDQLYESVQYIGWNGISDNSIIKGYHYQITTKFLDSDEVFEQETVYTEKDRKLIVFPSKESVNQQTIRVFAEDIKGNIDPVGDSLEIYTRQSVSPETEIVFPVWGDTLLVSKETDYIYQGIKVVVADSQPNPNLYANPPEIMDYLYKVDDGEWLGPVPDSAFYIDPAQITGNLEGSHTLYVKARNTAFKDDDTPASIEMYFYEPDHDELEWLVIDDTYDDRFGVSDTKQDDYFSEVFNGVVPGNYGMWDYASQGVVSAKEISKYKNVLYHCEHTRSSHLNEFVPILWQYVETGGNLMITSKEILDNLERPDIVEELKYFGNFTKDILHLDNYYDNVPNKLQAVTFGSDSVLVDESKISAAIGGVTDVTYINGLGNFAEPVFRFATADSAALNWNGRTVGSGYYNDTFRILFCGFPLYPFTVEAGQAILRKAITYFEEDKPF